MNTVPDNLSKSSAYLSDQEKLARLRLIRSRRVGVATFYRLMKEHGTATQALLALPDLAFSSGVTGYEVFSEAGALSELKAGNRANACLIHFDDNNYPKSLSEIPDPPPLIWVKGDLSHLNKPMIALVGARNASSLGLRMAGRLAGGLGKSDFGVVSGLARGIDAAAHHAAIDTGTVAVVAGGVDTVYPLENAALTKEISEKGVIVSEQPMGTQPLARHFPMRNRIISGMALGVVVVEAALKSGSLITARNALDQGREVMAVPGHPVDARASGCNALIRDGAILIRSAQDIIDNLAKFVEQAEPPLPPARHAQRRSLTDTSRLHSEILSRLGPSPLAEDQLIRDLGVPAKKVNPELTTLELEGRIERRQGGLLSLVNSG